MRLLSPILLFFALGVSTTPLPNPNSRHPLDPRRLKPGRHGSDTSGPIPDYPEWHHAYAYAESACKYLEDPAGASVAAGTPYQQCFSDQEGFFLDHGYPKPNGTSYPGFRNASEYAESECKGSKDPEGAWMAEDSMYHACFSARADCFHNLECGRPKSSFKSNSRLPTPWDPTFDDALPRDYGSFLHYPKQREAYDRAVAACQHLKDPGGDWKWAETPYQRCWFDHMVW
ncbi:MAG: hypothetical protein Q9214_001104 [Letrouitia sp. 1 TL-2023]